MGFFVPEMKGIPLEEIARLFGEPENIMVYSGDIRVNRNNHQLVVGDLARAAVADHEKEGCGLQEW